MQPLPNDVEILVSSKEYLELLDDSHFLSCLRAAGVDNWDGYDYALEILNDPDA